MRQLHQASARLLREDDRPLCFSGNLKRRRHQALGGRPKTDFSPSPGSNPRRGLTWEGAAPSAYKTTPSKTWTLLTRVKFPRELIEEGGAACRERKVGRPVSMLCLSTQTCWGGVPAARPRWVSKYDDVREK